MIAEWLSANEPVEGFERQRPTVPDALAHSDYKSGGIDRYPFRIHKKAAHSEVGCLISAEPVEGFEPPTRLRILITNQVESTAIRHWQKWTIRFLIVTQK